MSKFRRLFLQVRAAARLVHGVEAHLGAGPTRAGHERY
jgi:hypothetical protein